METMQGVKGYSDSREEEEEEEAAEEIIITREESSSSKHHYPFSSPSFSLSSSSPSTPQHQHDLVNNIPHQKNPCLMRMVHDHNHHHHHESNSDATTTTESHNSSSGLGLHHQQDEDYAASNFINHTKQIDFMDLSLRNNNNNKDNMNMNGEANFQLGGSSTNNHHHQPPTEKEHMFDKVVTPSDVGKLNRLVIPKQHAEKYFPLDSTSNEKGLLLNFEDRNGKLWRFRYSYWNSSQSYVMTKGWSRFVKEKKLDAGDIVSFQRGVGELYRHRLYIDWRRRPDQHGPDPSTTLITPLFLPNQPHHLSQYSIRWGGRLYSLPSVSPPPPRHHHDHHLQHLNCNNMYPFHHQQHHLQHHGGGSGTHHHHNYNHELNSGSGSFYYLRSIPSMPMGDHQSLMTRQQQEEGGNNIAPMIIDSVPVSHHLHQQHHGASSGGSSSSNNTNTAAKRLRLFGVNMECATSPSEEPKCFSLLNSTSVPHVTMPNSLPSSSLPPLHRLRVPHEDPLSSSARFGEDQRGEASMLFDLDPSLQYRK